MKWGSGPTRESQNQAVPEPPEDDLAAVVEGLNLATGEPLPSLDLFQSLSLNFNVQTFQEKMTRLFKSIQFNVSSKGFQEQERDYQLTVLGPCFSGQGDTI